MSTLERRFHAKVTRLGADECWPWRGATANGYGHLRLGGRTAGHIKAHRLAYILAKGDPGEQLICHTCDNPPCCNPAHLFAGDGQANTDDMMKKGRGRWAFGVDHALAKLDPEKVRTMRQMVAEGQSISAAAAWAGVAWGTAGPAVRRETWRHVE